MTGTPDTASIRKRIEEVERDLEAQRAEERSVIGAHLGEDLLTLREWALESKDADIMIKYVRLATEFVHPNVKKGDEAKAMPSFSLTINMPPGLNADPADVIEMEGGFVQLDPAAIALINKDIAEHPEALEPDVTDVTLIESD